MYVVNYGSGTVTPVSTATNKAGRAVRVGTEPESIAFTANGGTAVVANEGSNNDTTIDTATGASSTSPVGNAPVSVLIIVVTYGPTARPDRFTLSVCDSDNGPVPTGRNGYVVVTAGPGYEVRRTRPEELGPLPAGGSRPPLPNLVGRQGAPQRIPVGVEPGPIALSPRNGTVYVVNEGSGSVTPLVLRR
jgi:YVTN family beta-propeller protein